MKNIIKRIIVGIGIALGVMLFKENVFAKVYTGANGGLITQVDACGTDIDFNFRNGNQFQSLGSGTLFFNFGLQKVGGSATSMILTPRLVFVSNGQGNVNYVCNIGTNSITNSTYENQIYSVTCPVDADLSGVGSIHLRFMSNNCPSQYYYNLIIGGSMSFVTEGSDASEINAVNSTMSSVRSDMNTQFNIIGQQQRATTDAINNASDRVNNTLTSTDTTEAQSTGSGFFNNFSSESHGLSGVITAPLRLINSLTTASCEPLEFNLPIVHNRVSLVCMRSIYEQHFGTFFTLYQLLTSGVLVYMIMINLMSRVHDLQNPNNDRIAVLNL